MSTSFSRPLNNGQPPTKYWQQVFNVMDRLPEGDFFYITSLDRPGLAGDWRAGVVCAANREQTAIRIAEATHRLSTEAEIRAEEKRVKVEEDRCETAEQINQNKTAEHAMANAMMQMAKNFQPSNPAPAADPPTAKSEKVKNPNG